MVTFRAELFNALIVLCLRPRRRVSSALFGRISGQANTPRQGQVALRFGSRRRSAAQIWAAPPSQSSIPVM
jgi:hypothetical protein